MEIPALEGHQRHQRMHERSLMTSSQGVSLPSDVSKPTTCGGQIPGRCNCSQHGAEMSITCFRAALTAVPDLNVGPNLIKTLNLEQNNITSIAIGTFFGMKIERLLLSNNTIRQLKFLAFWGLEFHLETIDLSYNLFTEVPSASLRLLRNLRSLSLKGNKITKLKDFDFGYLRTLEVLALDKNPIATIAPRTFDGTQLSLLILNSIQLQSGLDSFPTCHMKKLKGLSLTGNGLSSIPSAWFRDLRLLRFLNLDENELSELDEDALEGAENSLETLELNSNNFHAIPMSVINKLHNLKILEMRDNFIEKIFPGQFNHSEKLQQLDLSDNLIEKVSITAFQGLDTIQRIDLRHNRLTTLDDRTLYWEDPGGRSIYLGDNPWLCNCLLKWVKREHKRKTNLAAMFADPMEMLCSRPMYMESTPVVRVHLRDFTCDHDYYYYYVVDESESDYDEEDMTTDDSDGDKPHRHHDDIDDEYDYDDYEYEDDQEYTGK